MPVYYGVSGKARKVTSGYYGVNGKSELIIGNNEVPSGYIQYKYIYKTGQNSRYYFSYSVNLNQYTEILCTFAISPNSDKKMENIFSAVDNSASIYWSDNTPKLRVERGSSNKEISLTTNKDYTLKLGTNTNGDCYLDNTKLFSDITTFSGTYMYLMDYELSGGAKNIFIKGFNMYDLTSKKDLLKLIPCISISANASGLYNTVDNTYKNVSVHEVSNTII